MKYIPSKYLRQRHTRSQSHKEKKHIIGTVNNCTCRFFVKNHSAWKHMYVVARRTKFCISERANKDNTSQPSPSDQSMPEIHTPLPAHTTPSANPNRLTTSTRPASFVNNSPPPPPTQAQTPAQQTIKQEIQDAPPSFSLQSYLNMIHASSQMVQDRAGTWAHQLSEHGVLQSQPALTPNGNALKLDPGKRRYTITSTPINPARLPAHYLNGIWQDYGENVLLGNNLFAQTLTAITESRNGQQNPSQEGPSNAITTPTAGPSALDNATPDIIKSSLPESFLRLLRTFFPLNKYVTLDPASKSQSTTDISQLSIPTLMEKEAKTDNIWWWAGNITRIITTTNYNHIFNKRTLQELKRDGQGSTVTLSTTE